MPESSKDSSQEDGPQSGGRRSLLTRVLIGAVVAPILTFVVLVVFFEHEAADDETPASVPGFRVSDGRILAPDGARFVVKGVTIPYGTFAGGDAKGLGTLNFLTVRSDLRRLRGLGVNTIKILVTPKPGDRDQMSRLRTVVRHARGQGFVVEIGAAFTGFESARDLMRELASTYRRDPYVWLQPMNEPNCPIGRPVPSCFDWLLWQRQQRALIKTIRAQGMTSPVVINTPGYSAALSRIDTYPLGDDGVVWGVHRYANVKVTFDDLDRVDERRAWADRSIDRAVIVDTVGSRAAKEFEPLSPWVAGFLDFVSDWVREEEGSGAIGFVWRWYDDNTMTRPSGALTPWGRLYVNGYLAQVPGRH